LNSKFSDQNFAQTHHWIQTTDFFQIFHQFNLNLEILFYFIYGKKKKTTDSGLYASCPGQTKWAMTNPQRGMERVLAKSPPHFPKKQSIKATL
jgi:hypothetical protein